MIKVGVPQEHSQQPVINGKPWLCSACRQVLGYLDPNQNIMRIKYKDLYVFIEGGSITTICRRCGELNRLEYTSKT